MSKEINSIYVEARQWFDKAGGNSYWSARLWIDGEKVLTIPMTYGYEYAYLHASLQALFDSGLTPANNQRDLRDTHKIAVYHSGAYGKKSELFKV